MNALVRIKADLLQTYTNLRGWRTRRKLVVIESDDWGAMRLPGSIAYGKMREAGIGLDMSSYDRLDCLEHRDDFQALMNVIDAHRDFAGRPATFTFNTVMGNPDFEAIEKNSFQSFYHQPFFDSYRYYNDEDLEQEWRSAIDAGLIRPQFHAREHLNSRLWMDDLRAGHEETRLAFNYRFYAHSTRTGSPRQNNYLCAYWPESLDDLAQIEVILQDGLNQFNDTFGFRSVSFVGCNYVWPQALECCLSELGVKLLQSQRAHRQPDPRQGGVTGVRRHYTGQKNRYGQYFSVRNVLFEPYLDQNTDWAARALAEISQSFRLNRPAIICSHRINYVGGMDMGHRNRSLKYLDRLLAGVRQRWPQVEFVTSEMLLQLMESEA